MLILSGEEAYSNLRDAIKKKRFRYPTKHEASFVDGRLLPKSQPVFFLESGEKVFTIGSCFAREIEHRLLQRSFKVPVLDYKLPPEEFPHPPAHMLNEYNAGSILQRIESVFGGFAYLDNMGIEETRDGYFDLFLHIHQKPVPLARLLERRHEIEQIYSELLTSDAAIITLGLTESWFDSKTGCYLNKAPSRASVSAQPGRYYFHRMDVDDVSARISNAVDLMNKHSEKKILLTVSPVPIEATFTRQDAILANYYSKATLRVAAQLAKEKYSNVDYFPSFEIAISGGSSSFIDDNVHIGPETVDAIMNYLVNSYTSGTIDDQIDNEYDRTYVDEEIEDRAKF